MRRITGLDKHGAGTTAAAIPADGAGGVPACGGAGRRAGWGRGKFASLPEQDELLQAGEDAGQAGEDEGVNSLGNPGAPLLRPHSAVQAGDLVAEGEGGVFHGADYSDIYLRKQEKNFISGKIFVAEGRGKARGESLLFVNKKKQKNFIRWRRAK